MYGCTFNEQERLEDENNFIKTSLFRTFNRIF